MSRQAVFLLLVCLASLCVAQSSTQSVSVDRIVGHLEALQEIATANNGNRGAGSAGYNASVEYIVNELKTHTNYSIQLQPFSFDQVIQKNPSVFQQVSPKEVTYKLLVDYVLMGSTGSGDVTAAGQHAGEGCDSSAFTDFVAGNIAIIARGNCDFGTKVDKAAAAGASGVIIYNYEGQGIMAGTLGDPKTVPVFSTTYELAQSWLASSPVPTFRMFADMEVVTTYTTNIIADSLGGREDSVVLIGSHLDSVAEGPGINDNGSGSALNLELAIQLYKQNISTANHVRFLWFSAEELGLLGSEHYVAEAVASGEIKNIAANLNFDMVASPNFYRAIYDGSGAEPNIRTACVRIDSLFREFFDFEGLAWDYTPFDGRSDYGPFIANGVPAGGLFTGAEDIKTQEMRIKYGGIANAAFDPCYHQPCDDIYNINKEVLDQNAHAAFYSLINMAQKSSLRSWLNQPTFVREGVKRPIKTFSNLHFNKQ